MYVRVCVCTAAVAAAEEKKKKKNNTRNVCDSTRTCYAAQTVKVIDKNNKHNNNNNKWCSYTLSANGGIRRPFVGKHGKCVSAAARFNVPVTIFEMHELRNDDVINFFVYTLEKCFFPCTHTHANKI